MSSHPLDKLFNFIKNDDLNSVIPIIVRNNWFNYCFPRNIPSLYDYPLLSHHCPVLCIAAYFGSYDVCKFLISNNSNMTIQDANSMNAIGFAIASNNLDIMELMLNSSTLNSEEQKHFFLYASKFNSTETFMYFCKKFEFNPEFSDSKGNKCIHYAALNGNMEILDYIIAHGGDINSKTLYDERTPLMFAVIHNDQNALKHILSIPGIQINAKSKFQDTALTLGVSVGIKENIQILLDDENIKINEQNSNGASALHNAAINNRIEIIKLLLNRPEIDVNIEDNEHFTPLFRAFLLSNDETISALYLPGKSILFNQHVSLLHIATNQCNVNYLKKLIEEWKMDINTTIISEREYQATSLAVAMADNCIESLKYLITVPGRKLLEMVHCDSYRRKQLKKLSDEVKSILSENAPDILEDYEKQVKEIEEFNAQQNKK